MVVEQGFSQSVHPRHKEAECLALVLKDFLQAGGQLACGEDAQQADQFSTVVAQRNSEKLQVFVRHFGSVNFYERLVHGLVEELVAEDCLKVLRLTTVRSDRRAQTEPSQAVVGNRFHGHRSRWANLCVAKTIWLAWPRRSAFKGVSS